MNPESGDAPARSQPALPLQLAARMIGFALEPRPDETSGNCIGHYKLLQRLGEGGFGVVWLAEQPAPMRRHVAVKIIKIGMDTEEVIARFEAERQALALMEHPNIARVFDGGATDAGRPYFVMELVRGVAITRYCDDNRLSAEARLRLFVTVCHAVQHAHQKGVIHRDLKPSNILITLHDGVPVPKIIDFGIAKATSGRLTEKTLFTQFHTFIGTPAYTSPEQMELSGLDTDTRSDIYSLGVLLYELLTGLPPFDSDALLQSGLEAMRHTIREIDPPRPSHRLGTLNDADRTSIAQRRGIDPAKLSPLLRGDLDWIAMRCLEKDRTRRYDTANALATDVTRYLNDEPVLARPPSAADRVRKFVRRHKLAVAAGVAVAFSLLAGLVTSSFLLVRERAARTRAVAAEATQSGLWREAETARARESSLRTEAEANAERARVAAAKSAQVAQFMTDMLDGVGPNVALGRDTGLLRGILDATARRLDTELRDQPAVAAGLRATLGGVYHDLGHYATAAPLLREAVATHRAATGNESAETAASLQKLGMVLAQLNQRAEAETALLEALAIRRKIFGAQHPAYADTLYELAVNAPAQRSANERRAHLEHALAIRRSTFGPEHAAVAQAIAGLGSLAQGEVDHDGGARLHAEALAMRRKVLDPDHPAIAESLDALGTSYAHALERKHDAALAFGESLAIRRKVLGDAHPRTVGSLLRFAGQLRARDVSPGALAMVREFIASQRRLLPRESPLLGPALLALASLLDVPSGPSDETAALTQEAGVVLRGSSGDAPSLEAGVIRAMDFFAFSKFTGNVAREGRDIGAHAVVAAEKAFGTRHGDGLRPIHILAWVHLAMGRVPEATHDFEMVLRLGRPVWGAAHPYMAVDVAALGACYRAGSRFADSRRVLEEGLTAFAAQSAGTARAAMTAFIRCELGLTLLAEARFSEAETVLRRALEDYDRLPRTSIGLQLRPRERAAGGLARALAGQGNFTAAELLSVRAFESLQAGRHRLAGDGDGFLREAIDAIVAVYEASGNPRQAAEWRRRRAELPAASP